MYKKRTAAAAPLFKLARLSERVAAYAQGKGYGAGTVRQENKIVHMLIGGSPSLAIDIGGNIGDYTAEIRRRSINAEIHTFEPSKTNVQKLRNRFSGDEKIKILPFAISDCTGPAILFSNEAGSGLGSLTKRRLEHFDIRFDVSESVGTIRFEDYWRNNLDARKLDIVKIDIEGHELLALKGFGRAVFSASVIQFEFGGCNIDTRTYFQDFWYFFKEHGFDLFRVTPLGAESIKKYSESDECFVTTNYIAVNRNSQL
jgi:FkbM family methyltransferase